MRDCGIGADRQVDICLQLLETYPAKTCSDNYDRHTLLKSHIPCNNNCYRLTYLLVSLLRRNVSQPTTFIK